MAAFEIKIKKDRFLEKVYDKCMNELEKFYDFKWNKNKPNIIIVNDRKTIDAFKGWNTESWVVGWCKNSDVFILNRKNFEKESNHKYNENEYVALIKHELSHSFFSVLSKNTKKPYWFNEGVAIYTSEQNKFKKLPEKFKEFLKFFENYGSKMYYESGFVIELLVNKYGKKKLLKMIKALPYINSKEEFLKKFKEIYGFEVNYTNFNKLLNIK